MIVKEITEKLLQVEEMFSVDSCNYQGIWVWPLLRLSLLNSASGRGLGPSYSPNEKKRRLKNVGAKTPGILVEDRASELKSEIDQRADIVFFSQTYHCVNQGEASLFHKFFDPLASLISEEALGRCSFVNLNDAGTDSASFVRSGPFFDALIDAVRNEVKLTFELNRDPCPVAGKILLDWNERFPDHSVSFDGFIEECEVVIRLAKIFASVIPPDVKSVFVCCFYSTPCFSVSLACQFRGIQCVELQHGQQGDWHPMYTHWSRISDNELKLIPGAFWMWGASGIERINRWGAEAEINAIRGGNPWLYHVNKDSDCTEGEKASFRDLSVKHVLVSMQNLELPEFFWKTVATHQDWVWHFRLHPRFSGLQGHLEERCASIFENRKGFWKVFSPAESDFYSVIRSYQLHLTGWSTTAYEALALGVPTVLIHKNGREAMSGAIEEGAFGYAENEIQLGDFLANPPSGTERRPTIECSEEVLLSGFEELRSKIRATPDERRESSLSFFLRPGKRFLPGSMVKRLQRRIEFSYSSTGPVNIRIGSTTPYVRGWISLESQEFHPKRWVRWHRLFRKARIGNIQIDWTCDERTEADVESIVRRAHQYLSDDGVLRLGIRTTFRCGQSTLNAIPGIAERLSMGSKLFDLHTGEPDRLSNIWEFLGENVGKVAQGEHTEDLTQQMSGVLVFDVFKKSRSV